MNTKKVSFPVALLPYYRRYLDLQLAAELGRCLLERNQELQAYITVLQKQLDDEQSDVKVIAISLSLDQREFHRNV